MKDITSFMSAAGIVVRYRRCTDNLRHVLSHSVQYRAQSGLYQGASAARHIGNGDLSYQVVNHSFDGFPVLGDALNLLTERGRRIVPGCPACGRWRCRSWSWEPAAPPHYCGGSPPPDLPAYNHRSESPPPETKSKRSCFPVCLPIQRGSLTVPISSHWR